MKKIITLFTTIAIIFGLTGCVKKASLESDFKDDKDSLNVINSTVAELEAVTDMKKFKYVSGDSSKKIATYTSGKCEVEFYVEDFKLSKIVTKDKGMSDTDNSDDFIACSNAAIELLAFDVNSTDYSKIIEFVNKRSGEEKNINGYIVSMDNETFSLKNKTPESLAASIPVTIDKIELIDFKCLSPNIIGTVYMQTQFKNNSDKTISSVSYEYRVDGKTTYLSTYDTLLPGDTSSLEDAFGPKSLNLADAELLKISITVLNEDNSKTYIDYDAKTKNYSWF